MATKLHEMLLLTALTSQIGAHIWSVLLSDKMEHIFWVCSYQTKWGTYSECVLICENGAPILNVILSIKMEHLFWVCSCQTKLEHMNLSAILVSEEWNLNNSGFAMPTSNWKSKYLFILIPICHSPQGILIKHLVLFLLNSIRWPYDVS